MDLESLQRAMVWVNPDKLHLGTNIGPSARAREVCPTGYLRFYDNSVTFSHRRYAFADFENETGCFMAKNTIPLNFQLSNGASLPEMYVGSNAVISCYKFRLYQVTYPQIPVSLM
jgi:hypothetical protein